MKQNDTLVADNLEGSMRICHLIMAFLILAIFSSPLLGTEAKKASKAALGDGAASSIDIPFDVVAKSVDGVNEEGGGGKKAAYTPDGSKIVVLNGSEVRIEDFSQPTVVVTIVGGFSNAGGLAITPDSSRALVADTSANVVVILNLRSSPIAVEGWVTPGDPAVPLSPTCVVVTPDGTRALVGNNNSAADQYRVAVLKIGQKVAYDYAVSIPDETGSVGFMNMAITPDGERALVVQNSNKVYILDLIKGSKVSLIQDVSVGVCASSVAITPDGKMALVTNYLDNTITVFDPSQPYICPGYTVSTSGPSYDVTIAPDGKRASVVNWDQGSGTGSIDVFDLTQTPRIVLIETNKISTTLDAQSG